MSKAKKITLWVLSILIVLAIIVDGIIVYRINNKPKPPELEVIPYEHYYIPQEKITCSWTKQEVKVLLNLLYDTSYTYSEQDYIGEKIAGDSNIADRHIIVLSNLSVIDYIWVLSHEIVHIKYQAANETFTEYTSIVTLYESEIIVFKKVALNRAKLIISGGYAETEYDCGYYLKNYFKI